jgi:hypothetical protein
MRNEHFLIVMHHSSLAKAAVNGLRICNMLQQATSSLFSNWQRRNKDQ